MLDLVLVRHRRSFRSVAAVFGAIIASTVPATFSAHAAAAAVVSVPASIPADCSKNVDAELSTFINGLAAGTTVQFPAGGCYAQSGRIMVRDKRDLTIDGNGSPFRAVHPTRASRSTRSG